MGSKQISIKRTTSAGYRLPNKSTAQLTSVSSVSLSKKQAPSLGTTDKEKLVWGDVVRKDCVWREFVEAEKRGCKRWDENWSFLKEYDSLGNKIEAEPLPEHAPVFSEHLPNTTNESIGSRINTELGKTLIHMDYILTGGNQKRKLGTELLPC
ncbi:ciliary microtubule inner protein 5 [Discoglossus pictus]